MKEFFRSMLGSCLGIFLAFFIIAVGAIGIGSVMSSKNASKDISEDGVLRLTFDNVVPEKTDNVAADMFGQNGEAIGLRNLCRLIDHAASDSKVKGIVLTPQNMTMGQATLLQVRKSLEAFKKSGKFIYAYADAYSQGQYYLCSVADSIFLNPNGDVGLQGFAMVMPFFKGSLDKLGVDFDVFYAGDFKSATEPVRRKDMSPENRIQSKQYLTEMMSIMRKEISKSRGIAEQTLDAIMSNLEGRNATKSKDNKLVDVLAYWDEFERAVAQKVDTNNEGDINYVSIDKYNGVTSLREKGSSKNKIAIVYAEGDVSYNNKNKGVIDNQQYLKIFDEIKEDDNIKAVVLRVNSGGGSALTSDIIWREIENIKAKGIPVIASFGDYAASGGYYIAAGADTIVAAPNTLTGSIGVFSMLPKFGKLATEKLGITFDTVKTHEMAVNTSTVFNMSEKEKKFFTESTNDTYSQFLDRVAKGRKMDKETVHKYAQGRVWTGVAAKNIGLVDKIGYLDDAIKIAANKAKIAGDYKTEEFPKIKRSFFENIMKEVAKQETEEEKILQNLTAKKYYIMLKKYNSIIEYQGVQARMIEHLIFY
jgi:protease IV